jgi:glutamine cyclotransferase
LTLTHFAYRSLSFATVAAVMAALSLSGFAQCRDPIQVRPEILAQMPHDPEAFTQGLLWSDGKLFESTGLYGQSSLRTLDPATGATLRIHSVPRAYFAEGLALVHGELIQLTWKEQTAFRYPLKNWERPTRTAYTGEGWGLTTLGKDLWMSDGSDTLFRRDNRLRILGKLPVRLALSPVNRINELEGVGNSIVANIWYSDSIMIIDARDGCVRAVVDASPLTAMSHRRSPDAVLNGVAYDPGAKVFYLTGKDWPVMFRVRLPYPF